VAEQVPSRVDRAALERIIQRAAELQTSEREIGEGLTPDEVLALGREVGIPARHLQQALAEERARVAVATPSGLVGRITGPSTVGAQRVVQGDPERVQQALVAWMDEHELLCVQRQQPGWVTWEPIGGFQAAIRRSTAAFGGGKRPFMLAKADTVTATLTPLEQGYCHVGLVAELRTLRNQFVGGAAAIVGAGVVGTAVLVTLGALAPVAVLPAIGGGIGAWAVNSQHEPRARRVQLGLERALDQLEQHGPAIRPAPSSTRGSVVNLIADEIRKALKA
jgi:hypothetical protein